MAIKINPDAYVTSEIEFEVPNGSAGNLKLFAKEIGYIQSQNIIAKGRNDKEFMPLAEIAVQSVHDGEGNHFTYEEILRLKREVSGPLFDAVIKVNGIDATPEGVENPEKN